MRVDFVPSLVSVALLFAPGALAAEPDVESGARVAGHVAFLASPELEGRKPASSGSKMARTYIGEHFDGLGLVPWGDAEDFMHPIVTGTNVVAVLPGSDPSLAKETVLISAHYDHLGKGHLGAADNAAGVAALLELATRFVNAPEPPKRTIAFAAFDSEERNLWGAVRFSIRVDFDAASIALNINIDMLGRKGFDVIEEAIFMSASHSIPAVDAAVAASDGLTVLPIPGFLTAGRGDHAVFAGLGIPTQFFSCGLYEDYHQEGDTLENLDLDLVTGSVDAIARVATGVANATELGATPVPFTGTDAMLASGLVIIESILAHPEVFPLKPEAQQACRRLQETTQAHLSKPQCDQAVHNGLVGAGLFTLAPILERYEKGIFANEPDAEAPGNSGKGENPNKK
jgi:hypothetical protein